LHIQKERKVKIKIKRKLIVGEVAVVVGGIGGGTDGWAKTQAGGGAGVAVQVVVVVPAYHRLSSTILVLQFSTHL
jgi:hypothetical protein